MRYLSLALFAEGPSDRNFLEQVIYRSTYEAAYRLSDQPVEIPEAFYRSDWPTTAQSRSERIVAAFAQPIIEGAIDLLFVHADADGDAQAALTERVEPCCLALRQRSAGAEFDCVPVIPVRETEAWALVDGAALRAELGTTRSMQQLGLPENPNAVEALLDAKQLLRDARDAIARKRSPRLPTIPAGLGNRVELNELRKLEAFQKFERHLKAGLRSVWKLDA
jgi:hypothetical protein